VPEALEGRVEVGTSVRVQLHNRRVAGWVVETGVEPPPGVLLRPLLAVRGVGPPASVLALAEWAAWRWAGPLPLLLRTASAPTLVRALPAPPRRRPSAPADPSRPDAVAGALAADALAGGGLAVVRLAPAHDPYPLVDAVCRRAALGDGAAGALVLVPERHQAAALARRLRQGGHIVALLPEQWASARAGGVVAVGTRAAAFAPLPSLAAAVVLDAHDETYHEERAPTWSAWEVVAERARRDQAPCLLVSPCPTLDLLARGRLVAGPRSEERAGWPSVEVVDRRDDDPRTGLYSPRLVELVRWAAAAPGRRVLCVLNRTGRARLLACAACGELARCGRCGSALAQAAAAEGGRDGAPTTLECRRCGLVRPAVCDSCSSTRLRALRVGVNRVREELEALAGTAVAEVTAGEPGQRDAHALLAAVIVGTEAVLHRVAAADAVAFLDFDTELLAPRLRAGEEALALLARAARLVANGAQAAPGGQRWRAPGRVVVQTRQPRHPAVQAAVSADPGVLAASEDLVRRELGLPPRRAMAVVSGPAADGYGGALAAAAAPGTEVRGPVSGAWSVLAPDHAVLAALLAGVPRPPGRLRIEVDPVRA
jgi:primosomal protein N' (replication factor Y)